MKIAIPLTATDEFPSHFGQAKKFTVFEIGATKLNIMQRSVIEPISSKPCQWSKFLRLAGVDVLLAGKMNPISRQRITQSGVKVHLGGPAGSPRDLIQSWLLGDFPVGTDRGQFTACQRTPHGACHGHN